MTDRVFSIVLALLAPFAGCSILLGQPTAAKQSAIGQCSRRIVSAAPVAGSLASDGNQIFVGYATGTIEAMSSDGLATNWRAELGGEFASDLTLVENHLAFVTNPLRDPENAGVVSTIRLLSKETGITMWAAKVAYSERYFIGRINGSLAIVSKEGQVTLLDRSSGNVVWQTPPFGRLSARPAFSVGSVVIATADKHLTVISAHGGKIVSRQPTDFISTAITFLKKDAVAAGDERGNVTLSGAENSKVVWRFKGGAAITSISETERGILVTSLDNFVYLISDYNGDVIWKRRLSGRVLEAGLASNGHMVVLVSGENSAYVIDMDQGKLTDSASAFEKDLINRAPVAVRDRTFTLTTVDSVEVYAFGGCEKK